MFILQWGLNGLSSDHGFLIDGREGSNIKMNISWLDSVKKVLPRTRCDLGLSVLTE